MKQYTGFASVYDTFMDNVPHEDWCSHIGELFGNQGIYSGVLAELGCGTGTAAMNMVHLGFRVFGIDNSKNMLTVARKKQTGEYVRRIRYSRQDMRSFSLPHPVRGIYSICDSMNYLTKRDDMIQTLRCVRENLLPGGIFIFDLKTLYFYEKILGDTTIADNYPGSSFIWENHYNRRTQINWYRLSVFQKLRKNLYRRFREIHCQRGYSIDEISDAVAASGLKLLQVCDARTLDAPQENSERIYFIVKKENKNE